MLQHKSFTRFNPWKDFFDFEKYHTYPEIENLLNFMDNHPKIHLSSIGKSHENRAIYSVSMGDPAHPKIVVDCGIHAREWVRPEL